MRAALLAAVREPFVVEDIDYLDPAPGRVLVRTGASPFCSTDCVNWRGELFKIPPTILGHASMGEVVEVGAGAVTSRSATGSSCPAPRSAECASTARSAAPTSARRRSTAAGSGRMWPIARAASR